MVYLGFAKRYHENATFDVHQSNAMVIVNQRRGHRSGKALQGHCESAHGGKVSAECPACRELQEKMVAA